LPRSILLFLIAVLLAIQPAVSLAQTDEPTPAALIVVGASGVTLRADPGGASLALAILPAGSRVTVVGPDAVTAGVVWKQVQAADGSVGYLPAGFLVSPDGRPVSSTSPATFEGRPPPQSVGSTVAPATYAPAPPVVAATGQMPASSPHGPATPQADGASGARPAVPSAAPTDSPVITTVERRRGQDVQVTRLAEASAPDGRPMAAGRIVIRFNPGTTDQDRGAAHQAAGTVSARSLAANRLTVVHVDPSKVSEALAAYQSRSDVAWAEPSYIFRASATPNDPEFPRQWGPQKIGLPIAWDVTAGDVVGNVKTKVAILDSGIFTEMSNYRAPDGKTGHPDLRGTVVLQANFSTSGTTDDVYGHGTLMAGIVAARANTVPSEGIAGIAYDVQLFNGKVLGDTGSGDIVGVAQGIIWAADQQARVISMSLGAPGPCSATLQDAIDYAWQRNVVIVAAAGNGGADQIGDPQPEAPANCNHVIAVAAINPDDSIASFSNYGPAVDLAAPGVGIRSTTNGGTYGNVSGTSPATPHVSAVAALVVARDTGATSAAIVDRLLQTADPIVGTGTLWANGRINAAAAVGPISCSPRPGVTVTSTGNGSALNVVASTTGVGNAVRFIRTGAAAGTTVNAVPSFPTPTSEADGTRTYVPQTVGVLSSFQVQRQSAGTGSTLPFIVMDGCGTWKSLAGGGPGAGF
jgi:thermitase